MSTPPLLNVNQEIDEDYKWLLINYVEANCVRSLFLQQLEKNIPPSIISLTNYASASASYSPFFCDNDISYPQMWQAHRWWVINKSLHHVLCRPCYVDKILEAKALCNFNRVHMHNILSSTLQAIDHIINSAAKSNYMSAGQISVPIVFRGPNGAAAGVGAQHSQVCLWTENVVCCGLLVLLLGSLQV